MQIVNRKLQDINRASLDSEVSRLWDLESLGIKSSDEVYKSFENDIELLDGR